MKRFICIFITALLCICLPACNSDSDSCTQATDAPAVPAATAAAKRFASIAEYLQDPSVQEKFRAQEEQADDYNSIIKMNAYAEEDTLVYEYTYLIHIDEENVASTKDKIDQSLDESSAAFEQIIAELQENVDIENPKVRMIYLNDDGTMITERIFG